MRSITLALMIVAVLTTPALASRGVESTQIRSLRGEAIPVDVHWPADAPGPVPVVILAPGQGYHKDLPLIREIAEEAARSSIAAVRFNWAYCRLDPAKGECTGEPSEDLSAEAADLRAVVDYARGLKGVDRAGVLVAGKSIGSLVAWSVFRADTTLRAVVLLTPVCVERDSTVAGGLRPAAAARYPGLAEETRPVVFVLGNRDRACPLPVLYDAAKDAKASPAVVVMGGNHGLELGEESKGYRERNAANIRAAAQAAVHWIHVVLGE